MLIAISGIMFFCLLKFHDYIPKEFKKHSDTFYTILEYSVFSSLMWLNIENKSFKKIMLFLSGSFISFQIIYFLTSKSKGLDTVPIGIESILIFVYIFYFFFEYVKNVKNQYLYTNYCFWAAIGIMIYLGGNFFFNILASNQIRNLWYLTYIPDLVKNILLCISFIIHSRYPNETTKSQQTSVPYLDMI